MSIVNNSSKENSINNFKTGRNNMYISDKFEPYEFVPESIYENYGEKSLWFIDDRMLITADQLREKYGKMIINNWYWDGQFDSRGFRPPGDPEGADLSQHRFGRALDIDFKEEDVDKVRQDILNNKGQYPFVHAVELDVSWLHIDCRNCDRILTFRP